MMTSPMIRHLAAILILGVIPLCAGFSAQGSPSRKTSLYFEPNQGQAPPEVRYLARGRDYTVHLNGNGAKVFIHGVQEQRGGFAFVGVKPGPVMNGLSPLAGKVNYYRGSDPKKWISGVSTFAKVEMKQVYPGVDVVYYGNQGRLEWDFVVASGADPSQIRISLLGVKPRLGREGELVLNLPRGELILRPPRTYQNQGKGRIQVPSRYTLLANGEVGLALGDYQRDQTLVIDPELVYSSFLGGSESDVANCITADSEGNIYVAGLTQSPDFPTASPAQGALHGNRDAFITKYGPDGNMVYSTHLGGGDVDSAYGIGVDSSGQVWTAGWTKSGDFPTMSPVQSSFGGQSDGFVAKLNKDGAMVFSSYLGGSEVDYSFSLDVDEAGGAWVAGYTKSNDIPQANAIQTANAGGYDVFLVHLNSEGSMDFSSFLGGGGDDTCFGVAVDSGGNVYLSGRTGSGDFPTFNPIQGNLSGDYDAFVARLGPDRALNFSTYLGGSGSDGSRGIAVDAAGNVYVPGSTNSPDFPTTDAAQGTFGGGDYDAFGVKLGPDGAVVYSTYLGGGDMDYALGIATNEAGNAYLVGYTASGDFPLVAPSQGNLAGAKDSFLTKLSPGGAVEFSTYLGGGQDDFLYGAAVDADGNIHAAGFTASADFPTVSPLQGTYGGGDRDATVLKFAP